MGGVILDVSRARAWLDRFGQTVTTSAAELTQLDAAIGDADHGTNMDRGFRAVRERALTQDGFDLSNLFKQTGRTLISPVGGEAGPPYGTVFLRLGQAAA